MDPNQREDDLQSPHGQRRGWRRWRKPTHDASVPTDELYLESLGRAVPVSDCLRPDVGFLISEDFCWRMAMADWSARRPRRWQRTSRKAWRTEGAVLQAKKQRLRQLAIAIGIQPSGNR